MMMRKPLTILLTILGFGGIMAVAPRSSRADQSLMQFEDFECSGTCPVNAPVCCYIAPPIIVIIE